MYYILELKMQYDMKLEKLKNPVENARGRHVERVVVCETHKTVSCMVVQLTRHEGRRRRRRRRHRC